MFYVIRKKHLVIALICCLLVVGVPLAVTQFSGQTVATAADNSNWGLSFQENGKTPLS